MNVRDAALKLRCPTCGAKPGRPCQFIRRRPGKVFAVGEVSNKRLHTTRYIYGRRMLALVPPEVVR